MTILAMSEISDNEDQNNSMNIDFEIMVSNSARKFYTACKTIIDKDEITSVK